MDQQLKNPRALRRPCRSCFVLCAAHLLPRTVGLFPVTLRTSSDLMLQKPLLDSIAAIQDDSLEGDPWRSNAKLMPPSNLTQTTVQKLAEFGFCEIVFGELLHQRRSHQRCPEQ